ncbi:FAD/NAD(P)-binding protein [Lactobacillaceae bacterium Melli_B4]
MKIAIIGAGPRGMLVAERSLHEWPNAAITIFDSFPIGGQTWQPDQDAALIMNTPAEQVQEFSWAPNLYEWCRNQARAFIEREATLNNNLLNDLKGLKPNDYPTRRIYAAYLRFCYQSIPNYRRIDVVASSVDKLVPVNAKYQLTFDGRVAEFDRVVITIDNGSNQLNPDERALQAAASKNQLTYLVPTNQLTPSEIDALPTDQPILIRGLGLNFYDLLAQLIDRWHGQFERDADGILHYQKNGDEHHLIVGSHRGLPHYPRPMNQDGPVSERTPIFLSVSNIIERARRKSITNYQAFVQLVRLEVEFRYYSKLVSRRDDIDLQQFQAQLIKNQMVPNEFNTSERLNWQQIIEPLDNHSQMNNREAVLDWLQAVTTDANKGSQDGDLLAGLNAIRGLYNTIRDIYIDPRISDDQFKADFISKFNQTYVFLISGAPSFRLEQLAALIRANVIEILPPQMQVNYQSGSFVASSALQPQVQFKAHYLIEARQPGVDIVRSQNPLIKNLKQQQLLTTKTLKVGDQQFHLRGANIDLNYQLVDANGHSLTNLYLISQLNVGQRWLTNVCPRSGDDYDRKVVNQVVARF